MRSPSSAGRLLRLGLFFAVLSLLASAADAPKPPPLPAIEPIQVMPDAKLAAEKLGMPTGRIENSATASSASGIGNTAVFAIDAIDGSERREWIVQLVANELKANEKALPGREVHMFVSTGREVVFPAHAPEAIAIRILGPYQEGKGNKGAKDIWSGALVNGQFLRIGLDQCPRLFRRLGALADAERKAGAPSTNYSLSINTRPFPKEVVDEGKALSQHIKITEEEERAFAAFLPALMDYFTITAQTKGVREILFEIIDIPWWKLVANGGQIKDLDMDILPTNEVDDSAAWGMQPGAGIEGFGLMVRLYKKPALLLHIAVTTPKPPLEVSAGVIALAASRPDGKGPRLILRMIGAKVPGP